MPDTPYYIAINRKIRHAFIVLTLVFFGILGGFAYIIADIQRSRESSCEQTYISIREVFTPFFPPEPRSKRQQERVDQFNSTIDELRKGCGDQVNP